MKNGLSQWSLLEIVYILILSLPVHHNVTFFGVLALCYDLCLPSLLASQSNRKPQEL